MQVLYQDRYLYYKNQLKFHLNLASFIVKFHSNLNVCLVKLFHNTFKRKNNNKNEKKKCYLFTNKNRKLDKLYR